MRHALRAAIAQDFPNLVNWEGTASAAQEDQTVFPCAPSHLRPSLSFIVSQVRLCAEDFQKRGKYEDIGETGEVVQEVMCLLDMVHGDNVRTMNHA